jgi:hypothetical protein
MFHTHLFRHLSATGARERRLLFVEAPRPSETEIRQRVEQLDSVDNPQAHADETLRMIDTHVRDRDTRLTIISQLSARLGQRQESDRAVVALRDRFRDMERGVTERTEDLRRARGTPSEAAAKDALRTFRDIARKDLNDDMVHRLTLAPVAPATIPSYPSNTAAIMRELQRQIRTLTDGVNGTLGEFDADARDDADALRRDFDAKTEPSSDGTDRTIAQRVDILRENQRNVVAETDPVRRAEKLRELETGVRSLTNRILARLKDVNSDDENSYTAAALLNEHAMAKIDQCNQILADARRAVLGAGRVETTALTPEARILRATVDARIATLRDGMTDTDIRDVRDAIQTAWDEFIRSSPADDVKAAQKTYIETSPRLREKGFTIAISADNRIAVQRGAATTSPEAAPEAVTRFRTAVDTATNSVNGGSLKPAREEAERALTTAFRALPEAQRTDVQRTYIKDKAKAKGFSDATFTGEGAAVEVKLTLPEAVGTFQTAIKNLLEGDMSNLETAKARIKELFDTLGRAPEAQVSAAQLTQQKDWLVAFGRAKNATIEATLSGRTLTVTNLRLEGTRPTEGTTRPSTSVETRRQVLDLLRSLAPLISLFNPNIRPDAIASGLELMDLRLQRADLQRELDGLPDTDANRARRTTLQTRIREVDQRILALQNRPSLPPVGPSILPPEQLEGVRRDVMARLATFLRAGRTEALNQPGDARKLIKIDMTGVTDAQALERFRYISGNFTQARVALSGVSSETVLVLDTALISQDVLRQLPVVTPVTPVGPAVGPTVVPAPAPVAAPTIVATSGQIIKPVQGSTGNTVGL